MTIRARFTLWYAGVLFARNIDLIFIKIRASTSINHNGLVDIIILSEYGAVE